LDRYRNWEVSNSLGRKGGGVFWKGKGTLPMGDYIVWVKIKGGKTNREKRKEDSRI